MWLSAAFDSMPGFIKVRPAEQFNRLEVVIVREHVPEDCMCMLLRPFGVTVVHFKLGLLSVERAMKGLGEREC